MLKRLEMEVNFNYKYYLAFIPRILSPDRDFYQVFSSIILYVENIIGLKLLHPAE